jgi:hypothetical protein
MKANPFEKAIWSIMKRLLFAGVINLVICMVVLGQPSPIYENDGVVEVPPQFAPQIDATNFVNKGLFDINFLSTTFKTTFFNGFAAVNVQLYDFSDTLNFTNQNGMSTDTGFRFDTFAGGSGGNGTRRMAANFNNSGTIIAGAATNSFFTNNFQFLFGSSKILVSATNVVSPGLLEVGGNGLLSVKGRNVDLTRGVLRVDSNTGSFPFFGFFNGFIFPGSFFNSGIFDQFWGVGLNTNQAGNFTLPFPSSPAEPATDIVLGATFVNINLITSNAYVFLSQSGPSNATTQVVFLQNTNPAITTDVRFEPQGGASIPVIQWQSIVTNNIGGLVTNQLYLSDTFGVRTNLQIVTNGSFGIAPIALQPTSRPINYTFSRAFPGYNSLLPTNAPYDPLLLAQAATTNEYTIYGVTLQPTTSQVPTNLVGASITNMPGRIEITADQVLNLANVQLDGANYITLNSTNHFVGSTNAQVVVPNSDINLASTNGSMVISNLLAPVVPRMVGEVDAWSSRWTNVVNGITNEFHVMIVFSALAPTSPSLVQDLKLRSTNLVVADTLNVTRSLLLDTERLTLTTNLAGFSSPMGEINLTSDQIVWSQGLPRLKYLTNFGIISTLNSTYFVGVRQPPYFNSTFDEPYQALVNHGTLSAAGETIWANYFENTGSGVITTNGDLTTSTNMAEVSSFVGPISLQANQSVLANGLFTSPFSDITIMSGDLVVSNHNLQAFRNLTFAVTNSITDGGSASSNVWRVGDGFDLLVKPPTGDLLFTTITNVGPDFAQVDNIWAGEDRGCSPAGFANNVAIGHMILDGGFNSLFNFKAAGTQNAIYIDLLELKDYATNRANPDFTGLSVDPNMMVYFADARIGNIDISEKLNGANGGRFCWVSSFAGPFSSMNIAYPSGKVYTFNRALAQSSSFDSDGDGIVNSADSTPFVTPENVRLRVSMTKQPTPAAQISWMALANSTNTLYCTTNMKSTNWVTLTNFVQGNLDAQVTITDPVKTNGPCFYRLRIGAK